MLDWIKRVFGKIPKEAAETLAQLNSIEKEIGHNLAYNTAKKRISDMIKESPLKVGLTMKEQNTSPRGVALVLLLKVSGDMAASGQYHVYRGTLNTMGDECLRLWGFAAKELVGIGCSTQQEIDDVKKDLWAEIKQCG